MYVLSPLIAPFVDSLIARIQRFVVIGILSLNLLTMAYGCLGSGRHPQKTL